MVNIEELAKASSHTGIKKHGYDDVKIDSNSETAEKSKDSHQGRIKKKHSRERTRDRTGQTKPQRSAGTTGDGTTQTTQFDDKKTLLTYTGTGGYTNTTKTVGSKESKESKETAYSKENVAPRTPQTPVITPAQTPKNCKSNTGTLEEQKVEKNAVMSPYTGGTGGSPRSGGKKSGDGSQQKKKEKSCCCSII